MKVYIATSGQYSDTRIVGAFSTLELAQKAGGEYSGVVEAEVDAYVDRIAQGLYPYQVIMLRNGDTFWSPEQRSVDVELRPPVLSGGTLYAMALARDAEHAVKIVNERRVQMIASGDWSE